MSFIVQIFSLSKGTSRSLILPQSSVNYWKPLFQPVVKEINIQRYHLQSCILIQYNFIGFGELII